MSRGIRSSSGGDFRRDNHSTCARRPAKVPAVGSTTGIGDATSHGRPAPHRSIAAPSTWAEASASFNSTLKAKMRVETAHHMETLNGQETVCRKSQLQREQL